MNHTTGSSHSRNSAHSEVYNMEDENMVLKRIPKRQRQKQNAPSLNLQNTDGSFFGTAAAIDKSLTDHLAVCAHEKSPLYSMRPLMRFLEYSCHGVPWILSTVFGLLATHKVFVHEILLNILMGLILDILVCATLKGLVRRPRPAQNMKDKIHMASVDVYSFPSGHATRAVLMARILLNHLTLTPLWSLMLSVWAASVCTSRVLMARHHVFDVICGAIIGALDYYIIQYFWLSPETCESIMQPILEELHL